VGKFDMQICQLSVTSYLAKFRSSRPTGWSAYVISLDSGPCICLNDGGMNYSCSFLAL